MFLDMNDKISSLYECRLRLIGNYDPDAKFEYSMTITSTMPPGLRSAVSLYRIVTEGAPTSDENVRNTLHKRASQHANRQKMQTRIMRELLAPVISGLSRNGMRSDYY